MLITVNDGSLKLVLGLCVSNVSCHMLFLKTNIRNLFGLNRSFFKIYNSLGCVNAATSLFTTENKLELTCHLVGTQAHSVFYFSSLCGHVHSFG